MLIKKKNDWKGVQKIAVNYLKKSEDEDDFTRRMNYLVIAWLSEALVY